MTQAFQIEKNINSEVSFSSCSNDAPNEHY